MLIDCKPIARFWATCWKTSSPWSCSSSSAGRGGSADLFHFRTTSGQEVDLVLEDASGQLVGIEVKAGATVERHDFRGLETMAAAVGKRFVRGVVLYTGNVAVPFGERLHALPIHCLWA